MAFEFTRPVLAVGAHLKNTFCLGKGQHAFVSHHIGDLDNVETLDSFREGIAHFRRLFDIEPAVIAHDLHPDYLSTRYAEDVAAAAMTGNAPPITLVPVQHHHAHIVSVLAEHGLEGPVIGVAFDGTGYGTGRSTPDPGAPDVSVWGGEFLVADRVGFERVVHLRDVPLPGGEQAIHQPWRMAAAWLDQMGIDPMARLNVLGESERAAWVVLRRMIGRRLNSPLTSSIGRLFDAVAALLGVRAQRVTYEGQAAVELEALADEQVRGGYAFDLQHQTADPAPVLAALLADLDAGVPVSIISAKFHNAVAALVAHVCVRLRIERGLNVVALSGGVFQNAFLLGRTLDALRALAFETYINQRVPANDGGIALGQAAVAAAVTAKTGKRSESCV